MAASADAPSSLGGGGYGTGVPIPAMWDSAEERAQGRSTGAAVTTTDSAFCPGSKLAFVPILEPGHGFRDKSLETFVSGGRTGTKCP